MGKFKIRHLVGKPQAGGHMLFYWQPSRTLRKLGFVTRRVAEQTNRLEDAIIEAERLNRELDDWRAGKGDRMREPGTLPWLVKTYRASERFSDLAEASQTAYGFGLAALEAWSAEHGHPPVGELRPHHARQFLATIAKPAMRRLCYAVLRLLLTFAVEEGTAERNVARSLRIKSARPRSTYWTREQVEALVRGARDKGRGSIALAVLLAVNLGQRMGDILRLAWSNFDAGSFTLRQEKTGQVVAVPASDELRAELAAAPRLAPTIVISESTGQPYTRSGFGHAFRALRAATGLPKDLRFHDLRRTAVVRLAEAGASVPEIAAVTGHSLDRTARMLEVYLPRTTPLARAAVTRLDEVRARTKGGKKLEG